MGRVVVAAVGMLVIAAVPTDERAASAPADGHARLREDRKLRPACARVARLSVIRLAGSASLVSGPMCANERRALWDVESYFEARATGCVDALNGEAFAVPRWLSTGADIESAFCLGELGWDDPDEFVGTLARAYELVRRSEPLTYTGSIDATAIRDFVIERLPDKLDACVAHAWRDSSVADLDVDIRLTPDGTVAIGSGSSVADCIALIVGGLRLDPVVRASLDISFRVHAIDPAMKPSVELGRRDTSDPTLDRAVESNLEYTLWRFRDCYARALRIGDIHEGDAVLTFELSSRGLSRPRATGLDPVLDSCIADAVTHRDFYGSRMPVHVRQELRFTLRPAPP